MHPRRFHALLAGLLVLAACGEDAAAPEPPRPLPQVRSDRLSPFGVGVTTRQIAAVDGEDAEPAQVEVWYPVDPDGPWERAARGRTPYTGLNGFAVRDLPILDGYVPFPVVIFSHGLAAIRQQSGFQVQYLASRGYVVLSADHHPSLLWENLDGSDRDRVVASAINRPLEILAQLDAAERWNAGDDLLAGALRVTGVVVMGHSFGGYSALSVSGARGSMDVLDRQCDEHPEYQDSINCDYVAGYDGALRSARYIDPRIAGVMPITPGATPLFAEGGLQQAVVPVFVWGGEEDTLVEPDLFLDWMFDELPAPKIYAVVPGAAHLDFSQICQGALPFGCGLDGPYTAPQILRMINDLTAAYVDWLARGDQGARERLTEEAVARRYPRLEYRAELEES